MSKVSFIGLGVMGYPMAGYIAKAGHDVIVYNRTKSKAEKWIKEFNGKLAETPKECVSNSEFIFSCVGNDDDLREVTTGVNGAFQNIKPGGVFVDNTTASAKVARELFNIAKEKKFGFLDAPVSGGQAGAENGALTVMIGGNENDFLKAQQIIDCYSKKMKLLGPSGSGQLAKMVNQICIAGLVQGLSEGLRFGQNAGLNVEDVVEVISKGAAQSWQMENRFNTMLDNKFDFGFAVDWMRKDLGNCFRRGKFKWFKITSNRNC
tara:strand:+ start:35947 stop:36735 length:789 start_codon:yes stop_codon:yes gene_type:complete